MEWLSIHFFYSGPLNLLLLKAVNPLIKDLEKRQLVVNFFFIRYWEEGPHIRLRLKGDCIRQDLRVKSLIDQHINSFFEKYPSMELKNSSAPTYPMNSIQQIDYVPEIIRYGGQGAIGIAEDLFEMSSRAVLKILESKGDLTYDEAVTYAVQLNVAFCKSFGMTIEETALFFDSMCTMMLPSVQKSSPTMSDKEVLEAFEQSFDSQRKMLVSFFSDFLEEMSNDDPSFEEAWLDDWIKDCKMVAPRFFNALVEGNVRAERSMPEPVRSNLEFKSEWIIWTSYVHMNNNRLGLANADESFISYLITRTLNEWRQNISNGDN